MFRRRMFVRRLCTRAVCSIIHISVYGASTQWTQPQRRKGIRGVPERVGARFRAEERERSEFVTDRRAGRTPEPGSADRIRRPQERVTCI